MKFLRAAFVYAQACFFLIKFEYSMDRDRLFEELDQDLTFPYSPRKIDIKKRDEDKFLLGVSDLNYKMVGNEFYVSEENFKTILDYFQEHYPDAYNYASIVQCCVDLTLESSLHTKITHSEDKATSLFTPPPITYMACGSYCGSTQTGSQGGDPSTQINDEVASEDDTAYWDLRSCRIL